VTTTQVKRPARIAPPQVPVDQIAIADPPTQQQAPPAAAGATMILMPIMSGVGSLIVAITNRGNKIAAIGGLLFLVGSITVGAIMIISQRSGPKRLLRESRERYLDYIEELRHALRETIAAQKDSAAWRHPALGMLPDLARTNARRWERRRSDSDHLVLRVGVGDQPIAAALTMGADTGPLNEFDPVCLNAAQNLQERYAVLHDQPVTVDLKRLSVLSVLGDRFVARQLASALALQLVTFHSPADVSLAVVRGDDLADAWEWVKWLPHVQAPTLMDGDVPARLVTSSVPALAELLQPEIERRLDERSRNRGGAGEPRDRLVVIVDGEGLTSVWGLESPDPTVTLAELGIHVVMLLADRREEPETVDDRIEVQSDYLATQASRGAPFVVDQVPAGLPRMIARQLSPLRISLEDRSGEGSLETTVGLPEILGVSDPATLDPRLTWRKRSLRDLLRVPIGVGANGGVVLLDLKESAHGGMGPHGMVVGATGSGKSEMLRTLVSSLVIGHGPDRLALMLVDFKGGATFAAMEDIPHIAGMITNLQDDLTLVDRMRDALFGEMQRRQEVLKKAGNLPNVTAYHELIDEGHELEPLPHLLVIIDEFSELLTAKPDFAELFVAIGRIGRSIGVHLLLATQKLEMGKIRGLESHLSYRISLRTFSEAESRDAIGVPDAYHLPPEPGSGYLKVDTTVFERFKAALVSSPYVPPSEGPKTEVPAVPYVAVNGLGAWIAQMNAEAVAQATSEATDGRLSKRGERSMLDVVCERLAAVGATRVRPVWLPPLPSKLTLDAVLDPGQVGDPGTVKAVVGLIDEPAKQSQYPLEWDFAGGAGNVMVVGAPQSGKSVTVRTLISSLALRYAPGDVAFYCLDFGGGSLRALADAPHVATVTPRTDSERISRTINDVLTQLDGRDQLFRNCGVSTIEEFRRNKAAGAITTDAPSDIFLVIDGWGSFREEYDALDYTVADIAARGLNYGVHVIITVSQSMEVRMRMQPAFGGRIELRLNDAFDSNYGRATAEQVTKDTPGRGVVEPGLLFHAALPRIDGVADDEDLSDGQAALVQALKEKWPDRMVERVRVLPEIVRRSELPPVEPAYPEIPVGVLDRNLRAASVDLLAGSSPHLLVFGDGETGKTNLLRLLLKGYMELKSPDELGIVVVDNRRGLLDVVPDDYRVAYCTDNEQTGQVAAEIAQSLRKRLPGKDVTSQQLRERSWWKGLEVLFVVDDYDLVSTSSGNPLSPLIDYLAQGRDLGFHLVVSRRMGGFARAQFEPMVQRLTDLSVPGFIFSGDRMEGRVIGGVTAARLPVGRALYANRNGLVGQVQTALDDSPAD
jgi:S-DNA-T family DNA segregation ATPase FtsK/SpoIIIE